MRLFEILLIIGLGIGILRLFTSWMRRGLPLPLFGIILFLIILLQFAVEGYRWQLLPAYTLVVLLFLASWIQTRSQPDHKKFKWISNATGGVLTFILLISLFLPMVLPIPNLGAPAGPYAVGTRTWHWVDHSRLDPYAARPDAPREILVQAWYPVDPSIDSKRASWMASAEIVAPAVANWINLPTFFLDHLTLVTTPAYQDALPVKSEAGHPVILFSHGYGGFRAQNTNQMLHLASHGFIVFAVEHTYGAVVTVFPDGRVAHHNPNTLPDNLPPAEDLQSKRALGDQWAGDLSFALDKISELNRGGDLDGWKGVLDLQRVGAFGHSTGGGAVIEFCYRDARCLATLTLDPFVKPVSGDALEGGLSHFAVHMYSETWSSSENLARFEPFALLSDPEPVIITVLGSAHYDFADLPLLSPLSHRLGLKGPINGKRMAEIANTYLLAYFEQTLLGIPSEYLAKPSQEYSEVIFQTPEN